MHAARLIVNPAAGRASRSSLLGRITSRLSARGFELEVARTGAPGEATELARDAVAKRAEVVFVLGGDGTVREAAAGLLDSETALAPLSGGTTNVLVRHLGLPSSPLAAAERYEGRGATLRTRRMDVGRCGSRPFLMMTSCGLDARTMLELGAVAKRRWGRLAVIAEGLRQLRYAPVPRYRVRFDDEERTASLVALCNIAEYAGPFRLAPAADPGDGVLDLVVFRSFERRAMLGFAAALVTGRHTRRNDVETHRVHEAWIEGPARSAVQIDGDGLDLELPVRVGIEARRLVLLETLDSGESLCRTEAAVR